MCQVLRFADKAACETALGYELGCFNYGCISVPRGSNVVLFWVEKIIPKKKTGRNQTGATVESLGSYVFSGT